MLDLTKFSVSKMTCWQYNNCPKEEYYNCPAYPDNGRDCWIVTGKKYNRGKNEASTFFEKLGFCKSNCNFFKIYIQRF